MDTNSPLQGALPLITKLKLVSSTTAAGTLYGISFPLYYLYLHASLPRLRNQDRKRQTQFMITLSTILMLCGLYYLVLSTTIIQDAYIKHSDFPGGPFLYEDSTYNTQPAIAVGLVCYLIVDISTAAIQIWRLWVVWSATRYAQLVVVLPFLCFLCFTAFRIRSTFLDVVLTGAEVFSQNLKPRTAELALQAIITILPTILIAGFLIYQNRRQRKLIGKSQLSTPYMNVVAMLIESYAVESTWTILHVILLDLRHPALQFFADTRVYIEIIAYLLVLYRVANGRAYGLQRAHGSQSRQDNVSSLHWNHITTQSDISSEADMNIYPAGKQPELGILRREEGSAT